MGLHMSDLKELTFGFIVELFDEAETDAEELEESSKQEKKHYATQADMDRM